MAMYKIENEENIDTPALLEYPQLIKQNILTAIQLAMESFCASASCKNT